MKIIKHYSKDNKYVSPDMSRIELAATVAKIFDMQHPMELDILDHFASQHCLSTMDVNIRTGNKPSVNGSGSGKTQAQIDTNFERLKLDGEPAKVGEQVAARASSDGDADAWILVNVLSYDPVRNCYLVQDEDDSASSGGKNEPAAPAIVVSAATQVKRLHDSAAHLHKGDSVLAVFPDTTSFYRGVVVRNPRPPGDAGKSSGGASTKDPSGWDVIVRFDDDEDDTGRSPPRRIPARFILLIADAEAPNLIQGAPTAPVLTQGNGHGNGHGNGNSRNSKKRNNTQMETY